MKKVFLTLSLLFVIACIGQPPPPPKPTPKELKEFRIIELSYNFYKVNFNYGFENTLDFNLLRGVNKNVIGLGYSTYIGNDLKGYPIGNQYYSYLNSNQIKDKAYYLLFGRQIKRLIVGCKFGICTTATYNNYLEIGGNPYKVFYSKADNQILVQYGGYMNLLLSTSTGVSLGYDRFNGVSFGLSIQL